MALAAVIAAIGFALIGPTATATAAPPTPNPTSDSPDREPSRWDKMLNKAKWQMYEWSVADALDPHDPYYKWKLLRQIGTARGLEWWKTGKTSFSIADVPDFVQDGEAFLRRSQDTPDGVRRQVTETGDKLHDLNQKIKHAQTPAEREEAENQRRVVRRQYKYLSGKLRNLKETRPEAQSVAERIQGLDTKISNLRNKISILEEETKKSRPDRREKLQQLKRARTDLAQADADRRRLQGPPDDDGGTGGTRTTPRGPKQPPKGPVSTGPTTTSTMPKGTTQTKGTTPAGPTAVPQGTKGTTATGPRASWKGWTGWSGPKTPKTGFRGSTGTGIGTEIAEIIGEDIGEDYAAHLDREHRELLEKARKDPALAKRIIDDYHEIKDNNEIEVLLRAFDTSKGFTQGATREIAPELIKSQKALDTAKATAAKSNADTLYRQARTECGGYDTCVTDRTDKLRKQNTKAIADSTKKANKSNADPLYRQARTECGGYDTCVTDRVSKLRTQEKATTATTKTRTEQPKQPQKKTHTAEYRGNGGVRATAA
ncbi:hypothetical protein AB0953_30920 [Streptomyces sp. NPDC046866]|uniref:hypothetical protein n=1 Tax=Streptomyces sp. NPDC046866 TaxID=3154921 RepID=UPI00345189F6